jgi:hypothetical protein
MFIVHLLYIACEDMTWSLSQHSGLVNIEQGRLSGVRLRRGLGGLCVRAGGRGGGSLDTEWEPYGQLVAKRD